MSSPRPDGAVRAVGGRTLVCPHGPRPTESREHCAVPPWSGPPACHAGFRAGMSWVFGRAAMGSSTTLRDRGYCRAEMGKTADREVRPLSTHQASGWGQTGSRGALGLMAVRHRPPMIWTVLSGGLLACRLPGSESPLERGGDCAKPRDEEDHRTRLGHGADVFRGRIQVDGHIGIVGAVSSQHEIDL